MGHGSEVYFPRRMRELRDFGTVWGLDKIWRGCTGNGAIASQSPLQIENPRPSGAWTGHPAILPVSSPRPSESRTNMCLGWFKAGGAIMKG